MSTEVSVATWQVGLLPLLAYHSIHSTTSSALSKNAHTYSLIHITPTHMIGAIRISCQTHTTQMQAKQRLPAHSEKDRVEILSLVYNISQAACKRYLLNSKSQILVAAQKIERDRKPI